MKSINAFMKNDLSIQIKYKNNECHETSIFSSAHKTKHYLRLTIYFSATTKLTCNTSTTYKMVICNEPHDLISFSEYINSSFPVIDRHLYDEQLLNNIINTTIDVLSDEGIISDESLIKFAGKFY